MATETEADCYKIPGRRRAYTSWHKMIDRCENKRNTQWRNYGGRGITVCASWHTFATFYRDMGNRPVSYTLDRIDNEKGYSPGNCRWATMKEQLRNTRRTHRIEVNGHIYCSITALAEALGMKQTTLRNRLHRNWSHDRAIAQPVQHRVRPGETKEKANG